MDRNNFAVNRILEEAANLVGREKEATGNVEPTEGYKGRQIEKLKEFATIHNLWIDFNVLSLMYLNKGGENEVPDEYHNELYELFDAAPNNVLYGIDGQLYFIDTQIRLR